MGWPSFAAVLLLVGTTGIPAAAGGQGHISPDGRWRCHGASVNKAATVVETKTGRLAWKKLPDEMYVDVFGDDHGEFVWAPNSRRFAFNYPTGTRTYTTALFQLDGGRWREPASVDTNNAFGIEDAVAAQEKKAGLAGDAQKRDVSESSKISRWLDPANAELLVYEVYDETPPDATESIAIMAGKIFTLAFDKEGN
jgi:hypothetical protein